MGFQQLLDGLPIVGIFAAFTVLSLLAYEGGYRVGRWWQHRTPDEKEGPTSMLVGSLLALLAFLLAVTMGMASDRFDARRRLVLEEANAIGTVYLRAGFLPPSAADQSRALLREYAPLRVNTADEAQLEANLAASTVLQTRLWEIAEPVARDTGGSEMLALYVSSLNDMIDLGEERLTAIVYARVPETIIWLLGAGAILTLGMVGFHAGLTRRRSMLGSIILIIVLGAVIAIVIDLDRPRRGFLQVSQQPIYDVIEQIGPPAG